jgi:hypothetical protein
MIFANFLATFRADWLDDIEPVEVLDFTSGAMAKFFYEVWKQWLIFG